MTEQMKMTIPAEPRFISIVRLAASSLAASIDFDIEEVEDIRVCVSEALNNAMASGKPVDLRFTAADRCICIEVDGFTEPETEQGKMGLLIIQSLMDVVTRTSEGIHMEKSKESYE